MWTTDKPTTTGYFWYRISPRDPAEILFVQEMKHTFFVGDTYGNITSIANKHGEWQGPITPLENS